MIHQVEPIQALIASFYRDFRPTHSGWLDDFIEWTAEAIGIMKVGVQMCETNCDLEVSGYKAKLPCTVEEIFGFKYNGKKLKFNGGLSIRKDWNDNTPYSNETYTLNPNYINTSFESGTITIYYWGFPVDCDGFPMIVSDTFYKEAIKWYCLMKLIGSGYKHPTFDYNYCNAKWENIYPKAQNSCIEMTFDELELWCKNFVNLTKVTDRNSNFYRTSGSYDEKANLPGSLLQTFQVLGNREQ